MADLTKRITKLKETISTAKAEKKLAKQRMEEIEKELEEKGMKVSDLDNIIKKKEKEIKDLEIEIEKLVEAAENELNKRSS